MSGANHPTEHKEPPTPYKELPSPAKSVELPTFTLWERCNNVGEGRKKVVESPLLRGEGNTVEERSKIWRRATKEVDGGVSWRNNKQETVYVGKVRRGGAGAEKGRCVTRRSRDIPCGLEEIPRQLGPKVADGLSLQQSPHQSDTI